ncbi:hypothetical protein COLO4_28229 [Corchorus olitorius]|uniref:Uncharacterized protein n=1 Tax=Corchorus olitorius TaxID=93759 RepID=A0A1R3HMG1_9ROSI|nr:hypothetical protein COLO4_28229 [Corchorus olitorius]
MARPQGEVAGLARVSAGEGNGHGLRNVASRSSYGQTDLARL